MTIWSFQPIHDVLCVVTTSYASHCTKVVFKLYVCNTFWKKHQQWIKFANSTSVNFIKSKVIKAQPQSNKMFLLGYLIAYNKKMRKNIWWKNFILVSCFMSWNDMKEPWAEIWAQCRFPGQYIPSLLFNATQLEFIAIMPIILWRCLYSEPQCGAWWPLIKIANRLWLRSSRFLVSRVNICAGRVGGLF